MPSPSQDVIATAYLAYLRDNADQNAWAFDLVLEWGFDSQWENVWQLILAICREPDIEDRALAALGSGPLEDLLCNSGRAHVDRVIAEASINEHLARMLTGVWGGRMEPATWDRVLRFCQAVQNPIDGKYPF